MTRSKAELEREISAVLDDDEDPRSHAGHGGICGTVACREAKERGTAPKESTTRPGQQGFAPFAKWQYVVDAATRGERLWYHAPMDLRPRSVRVVRVFKNGKIRIDPMSNQAYPFTADAGHLDRFLRKA